MHDSLLTMDRQKRTPFLASGEDYASAKAVILGVPMDWTASFRPGSRFGPASIREVSEAIEEYSFYRDKSLFDLDYYDAGDLILPFGNVEASLELIRQAVTLILDEDKTPLLLGGEHLITYPVIQAMQQKYPDLRLLHFDAHADLREAYIGQIASHTSVMRLTHAILGDGRIYQFGIHSGAREEFSFAAEHTRLIRGDIFEGLSSVRAELAERPVYVSIDIDVLDPAHAPGTGTPECGGQTSSALIGAFDILAQLRIIGLDLVEVLPANDFSSRTSLLAAVLLREALMVTA